MKRIDLSTRILVIFSAIVTALGLLLIFQSRDYGKLRIIFCDVWQGDGMLIISPSGNQAVVDGGPGNKILDCLGKYMPFSDRAIELMVSTHPQQDHMEGLLSIFQQYKVNTIVTTNVMNRTKYFEEWQRLVAAEGARIYEPEIGDKLVLDSNTGNVSFAVLWPGTEQIEKWKLDPPRDLNETSVVLRLEFGQFCAYLTGDIPKEILQNVLDRQCDLLKVAHHGSKTGTNKAVLDKIKPQMVVIQVGKNNRYGHPHKEIIDLLISYGIKILRNDISGTIEVESDGQQFWIR